MRSRYRDRHAFSKHPVRSLHRGFNTISVRTDINGTYEFHLRISELHFSDTANFLEEDGVAFLRRVLPTRIQIWEMHCDPLRIEQIRAVRREPFHAHFYAPFTAVTMTRTQCSHFRSTNPSQLATANLTADRSSSRTRHCSSESRKLVPGMNAHPRPHSFRHHAAISHFDSRITIDRRRSRSFARARYVEKPRGGGG